MIQNHNVMERDDLDIIATADDGGREWQCIECGFVKEGARPKYCPHCNMTQGDVLERHGPGVNLFIRREACGWFE